jgi:hypothetical protein
MINLLARVDEPRRWSYLVASAPFFLVSVSGWHAGAGIPYAIAGVICAAQFAIPTVLGWWIVFTCYVAASVFYLYSLGADLYRLARGSPGQVLSDVSDSIAFSLWIGLLLFVTWLLWRMRAARATARSPQPVR